jgi:hypothetical protein
VRGLSPVRSYVGADYWYWFNKWAGLEVAVVAFLAVNALGLLAMVLMWLGSWVVRGSSG